MRNLALLVMFGFFIFLVRLLFLLEGFYRYHKEDKMCERQKQ
jgi:hypothetical protein